MAIKFDIKTLPVYLKVIIAIVPSFIVVAAVLFFYVSPKQKQIKQLEAQIAKQDSEIAASQAKAAKLEVLKLENEKLLARINELKEQLPEEKEITSLLKQVSDMGISSGLDIKSWKPAQKVTHSSGIVYEIPVSVEVLGAYHNLGTFFGTLTRLNRIVNISDMKLQSVKKDRNESVLQVSFKAATFSIIPESEMAAKTDAKSKAPAQAGAKPAGAKQ
jgi:type IV pilus assembly protein PilO